MATFVCSIFSSNILLTEQAAAMGPRIPLECHPLAPGPMPLERLENSPSRAERTSLPAMNPSIIFAPDRSRASAAANDDAEGIGRGMISIVVVEAMSQCAVDERRIARRRFQRCAQIVQGPIPMLLRAKFNRIVPISCVVAKTATPRQSRIANFAFSTAFAGAESK